jgi:hypothetical protein
MDCIVEKLKETINISNLPVFESGKVEKIDLVATYTANSDTGIINHSDDWKHLAGVVNPISNSGSIKIILNQDIPNTIVNLVAIYVFSEYDDVTGVHTLNTNYGDNGRIIMYFGSQQIFEPTAILGADAKFITVRVSAASSDLTDFIAQNVVLQKLIPELL